MINPTKDERLDYLRYGKIPLGFYETSTGKLEPLDNASEIRAAKELADVLQEIRRTWAGVTTVITPDAAYYAFRDALDAGDSVLRKVGRLPND